MAIEAVVSYVIEKLNDHLIQEERLYYGVRHQLKWILSELTQIRYYLKDADSRQSEDKRVNAWVAEIRGVCYNVEDFMDTFIPINQTTPRRHGCLERLNRCIRFPNELKTHHKARQKIERIKQKFEDISVRRVTFGIRDINEWRPEAGYRSPSLQGRREFLSFHEESEVVGLQEETDTLKKQLLDKEQMRRVISIVGMGGSGKTTLAKKVCHDRDVRKSFECLAFIHLSQQYAMKDVLKRIINRTMTPYPEDIEKLSVTDLESKLHDYLVQRRYLLVIDDIWSAEAWDTLNSILPDAGNGSRVMLTTRMKHITSIAGSLSYHHEMHLLNDDDSWELFLKSVFPGSVDAPSELKEIGKEISAKCGGLPLAILALGGLLSRKDPTQREWSKVLASVSRNLPERFEQCRKILALSYWDLPYYLKPCFLYLGIFPGNYEITSEKLIRLWIAEGFIEQKDNQIIEDIAEDYLEELVSRSLVQATSRRSNGSIRTCRIHNLLRDFSISEARQNSFFAIDIDKYTSSSLTSVRRLVLHHSIDGYETINHLTATLRSILCFPGSKVPLSKLLNICGKLLRVLVADGEIFLKEQEVGGFVHLRYLEIAAITGGSLPSIGNLSNLQTLKLSFGGSLPHAIWNLVQLRHLSAYDSSFDGHPKLQNLKNLQTLCLKAGSWIEDGLSKLTNLRTLVINGNLSSYHYALSHSICKLCNLQSLQLYDGHSIPPFEPFSPHSALYKMYLDGKIEKPAKLPLPENVVELTLKSSLLGQDVISMLEKLPCLKILELLHKSYDSKEMICSSRGFPCLELLKLCELPLECLTVAEGAMMSLKRVELFNMFELKTDTLPEQIRALIKQNLFKEGKQSINQVGRKSGDISMPHVTTSALA